MNPPRWFTKHIISYILISSNKIAKYLTVEIITLLILFYFLGEPASHALQGRLILMHTSTLLHLLPLTISKSTSAFYEMHLTIISVLQGFLDLLVSQVVNKWGHQRTEHIVNHGHCLVEVSPIISRWYDIHHRDAGAIGEQHRWKRPSVVLQLLGCGWSSRRTQRWPLKFPAGRTQNWWSQWVSPQRSLSKGPLSQKKWSMTFEPQKGNWT